MFDFDVGKLMIFGIVALAVIPPKDLPRVMRTVGQYVGKMRRMASDFQGQFMDAMKEADIDALKKEIEQLKEASKVDVAYDPVSAMRAEMTNAIEPPKEVASTEIETKLSAAPADSAPAEATVPPPVAFEAHPAVSAPESHTSPAP